MASATMALTLFLLVLLTSECGTFSITGETSLRTDLLANYSTHVRPTDVTEIQIAFNILSIQQMNIRDQQISFVGWYSLAWVDPRLSWTPSSYHNVSDIHTDDDHIWFPVLVVDNAASDLSPIEDDSIPMRVTHDGRVRWAPPGIITTSCDMDPTYFPFDKHVCYIQITSFGYTLGELNLTVLGDGLVTNYYQTHGEWELLSHSASRAEFNHDGDPYARILLKLTMRRLPGYHGINLILPVIINSILVAFVFKVSPDSGEKIGYTLTILLAYMVILTLLAGTIPATSVTTSLMEVYVSMVLVLSTASTLLTVYIQRCFYRPDTDTVPTWLLTITLCISRCLCFKTVCEKTRPETTPIDVQSRRLRSTKTPVVWDTSSISSIEPRADLTWKDISLLLDEFFFWVFFTIIGTMTVIILVLLVSRY